MTQSLQRYTAALGLIGLALTGTPARADSQQIYLQCLTNFEAYVRRALFPAPNAAAYFRLSLSVPSSP